MVPFYTRAGIFSDLWKFVAGNNAQANKTSSMAAVSLPLLGSQNSQMSFSGTGGLTDDGPILASTQDNALIAPRNPLGTMAPAQDLISVYMVQPGDTPGSIAQQFGISLNTLLWANGLKSSESIKVGDQLIILPVSGIKYVIKKGDTIESVAKQFKGDAGEIQGFNGLAVGEPLEAGSTIIIPEGEIETPQGAPQERIVQWSGMPDLRGYYLRPILGGRRTQGLHFYNGVDLANYCGAPILAAAEGTVIIARDFGWNGGYGKYVVMEHLNGTQTLYAHLSAILAKVDQFVAQGSEIAEMGRTGNATGCHVHFEVRGAKNPF